jgi:hypothetical protein
VETILDALLSNSGVVESLTCEIFRKFCMKGKYFQNILLVMFLTFYIYLFFCLIFGMKMKPKIFHLLRKLLRKLDECVFENRKMKHFYHLTGQDKSFPCCPSIERKHLIQN